MRQAASTTRFGVLYSGLVKINWGKFIISLGICLFAGFAGAVYTSQSVSWWYPMLHKPSFSPPAWVFGPVWIILYLLMGASLYLVWNKKPVKKGKSDALAIFVVQLILNVVWSYLFFGLRNPFLGLVDVLILWLSILFTFMKFVRIDKLAGYLLIPYLLWVAFAGILNLSIVLLN